MFSILTYIYFSGLIGFFCAMYLYRETPEKKPSVGGDLIMSSLWVVWAFITLLMKIEDWRSARIIRNMSKNKEPRIAE